MYIKVKYFLMSWDKEGIKNLPDALGLIAKSEKFPFVSAKKLIYCSLVFNHNRLVLI